MWYWSLLISGITASSIIFSPTDMRKVQNPKIEKGMWHELPLF